MRRAARRTAVRWATIAVDDPERMPQTGVWVHLAATVDTNTNLISLYLNGAFADRGTRPSDIIAGDSTLYFGRWNMDGRLLNGYLDDVAIWGRALGPAEIGALATRSP